MEIEVKRIFKKEEYTIGRMYLNGKYFCDTLEDKVRKLTKASDKVYGRTAIPEGVYEVVITWSQKFKRNLPLLLNVPYYDGVRIHAGTTAEDTLGCVLVGENKAQGRVINSRIWEGKLMDELNKLPKGQKIVIRIH